MKLSDLQEMARRVFSLQKERNAAQQALVKLVRERRGSAFVRTAYGFGLLKLESLLKLGIEGSSDLFYTRAEEGDGTVDDEIDRHFRVWRQSELAYSQMSRELDLILQEQERMIAILTASDEEEKNDNENGND